MWWLAGGEGVCVVVVVAAVEGVYFKILSGPSDFALLPEPVAVVDHVLDAVAVEVGL